MGLLEKLQNEMKQAMKNKDRDRLSTIRMLISEIKKVQIDSKKDLSDEEIVKILQKYAKQRKDAIEQYKNAGREDLVEKEEKELKIVNEFLPEQLSEEEVEKIVAETIEELNASSMKDMGRVMKAVMSKIAGKADGSIVSKIVKNKLNN
jgi:uncharacterized protein YqeY